MTGDRQETRASHPMLGLIIDVLRHFSVFGRDRLELLLLEYEEEKDYLLKLICFAILTLVGAMHVLLLTSLALVFFTPEEHRQVVVIVLLALHWIFILWAAISTRALLKNKRQPCEATLDQLGKDIACLKDD